MADLYRVIYVDKGGQNQSANVVATSEANAIAALKTSDTNHKMHGTATVIAHNIITGS